MASTRRPSTDEPLDSPSPGATDRPGVLASLWGGAKSGAHATAVMTLFRVPISDSTPPPSEFLAQLFGGTREEYPVSGMVLHHLYGMLAGTIFGVFFRFLGRHEMKRGQVEGALYGAAFGVVLSVFGRQVLLGWLLGETLDDDERFIFQLSHVVYGLTLGTSVGSKVGQE